MKTFVIIGGVAGGATAAARLRRLNEQAHIILFERGENISFANCGLPYHIGGIIKQRKSLLVTTSQYVTNTYNIDIRTLSEITKIITNQKSIIVSNLLTGETYSQPYDKLLLSPGAAPITPDIIGHKEEGVFSLRNMVDMDRIIAFINEGNVQRVVVAGGGFIGLEMVENFSKMGLKVSLVQRGQQTMKNLDFEMAAIIHDHLRQKGVSLHLGETLTSVENNNEMLTVMLASGRTIACNLVLSGLGVKPEVWLARDAGLEIGPRGGITVDQTLCTSDPDIYAVGDAIEVIHKISEDNVLLPLAGPANKQGRLAADNMNGDTKKYKGIIGTSILHVFDLTIAKTGLSEKELKNTSIPFESITTHPINHAGYFPGAVQMSIKMIFSTNDGQILGAQIVGGEGVDKRIDVLATAIHAKMTVYDLAELELAYAPQYSSAKDPVNMLGFMGENILDGNLKSCTWDNIKKLGDDLSIIDVRTKGEYAKGSLDNATNIPVAEIRQHLESLPKNKPILIYCQVGIRGYIACRILMQNGFEHVYNLSGGYKTYTMASFN